MEIDKNYYLCKNMVYSDSQVFNTYICAIRLNKCNYCEEGFECENYEQEQEM